jgi:threonine/homoserine/homoserine lactone efflux protein
VELHRFLLYVLTEAALSVSPGPAVLFVVASALSQSAARAVWAILGILSANTLYFVLSGSGLGSVLASSAVAFTAVKILGALYLVYLGALALFGRPSPISLARPGVTPDQRWRLARSGLLLQLGNPKSLLFFLAILPQFIDPAAPVLGQMLWLGAGSILPEFVILLIYAALAGRAHGLAAQPRFARWTERFAGGLMLGIAALVLSASR